MKTRKYGPEMPRVAGWLRDYGRVFELRKVRSASQVKAVGFSQWPNGVIVAWNNNVLFVRERSKKSEAQTRFFG